MTICTTLLRSLCESKYVDLYVDLACKFVDLSVYSCSCKNNTLKFPNLSAKSS